MPFSDFISSGAPLDMLFAWQQGGDEEGPGKLIAAEIGTDDGLVSTLEHLSGVVHVGTMTGVRERITLSRSNIASLIDYEDARARIEHLAEHATDAALKERARQLRQSFENGDRF